MNLPYHSSFIILVSLLHLPIKAQIGIGTTNPNPSAILEVKSNSKGFLPPRLTEQNRNLIPNPEPGLMVYNIDDACINFYNGLSWVNPCLRNTGQTVSSVIADANFPASDGTPSLNDLEVIGLTGLSGSQTTYEEAIANASPQPTTLQELQTIINGTKLPSQVANRQHFSSFQTVIAADYRSYGYTVRCIKD